LSELDEFTRFIINQDGTFNSTKGRRKLIDPILPDVLSVDRLETIIQKNMCPLGEDGHAYVYELACELMTMLKAAKFEDVIRRPYGIPGLASIIDEIGVIATIRGFEDYYIPEMVVFEPDGRINDAYDKANRLMKGTKHYVFDPDDDEELDSNDYVYAYRVLTSLDSVDYVTHSGVWSKVFDRSMEVLDFGRVPMGANTLNELEVILEALNEINNPTTRKAGLFVDRSGRGVEYFWLHWQRRMRTIVHRAATWQVYGPNRILMGDLYRSLMKVRDETLLWLPRTSASCYAIAGGGEVIELTWSHSKYKEPRKVKPLALAESLNRVRTYVLGNDKTILSIETVENDNDTVTHFIHLK
jgi:hypothetical protein